MLRMIKGRSLTDYGAIGRAIAGSAVVLSVAIAGCARPQATETDSYEARLATHLAETGATMYGAFWCPHCADQKALFGDASKAVPYVECDPDGKNGQPDLCRDKGIQGYPTWEIEGQFYPGTRTLEELADLSGFESP